MSRLAAWPCVRGGLVGGLAALVGVILYWGFTVDDALISARVAHHLATGLGYRFNATGPVVDAVTPLGWAYCLAPFARHSTMQALAAGRLIGAAALVASSAWLGVKMARQRVALWPLLGLAVLSPVGLWASAGMETATVTALVTLATEPGLFGLGCIGLAAAWRPELMPFAAILALGRAGSVHKAARDLAIVLTPALVVALVRWISFGHPHPLAVVAKPSDSTHGFWYALEALVWAGPTWLWLSPGWPWGTLGCRNSGRAPRSVTWLRAVARTLPGWPTLRRSEAVLMLAIVVHYAAIWAAGGDWMPAYRLAVPVLPAALRVACHVAVARGRVLTFCAVALAGLACWRVGWKLGPTARHVVEQRSQLVGSAAAALGKASVVAAPDVGWVGAAFPGPILDLAGATDQTVAFLHGGHTSKQVELRLFVSRGVDYIVVLLANGADLSEKWAESRFSRAIDRRAAMLGAELGCEPTQLLPLAFTKQSYLVLRCPKP